MSSPCQDRHNWGACGKVGRWGRGDRLGQQEAPSRDTLLGEEAFWLPAVWALGSLDYVMWFQGRCKTSFCDPTFLHPPKTGPVKSPCPETASPTLTVSRPSPGPWAIFAMPVLAFWGSSPAPPPSKGMRCPACSDTEPRAEAGWGSRLLSSAPPLPQSSGWPFGQRQGWGQTVLTVAEMPGVSAQRGGPGTPPSRWPSEPHRESAQGPWTGVWEGHH